MWDFFNFNGHGSSSLGAKCSKGSALVQFSPRSVIGPLYMATSTTPCTTTSTRIEADAFLVGAEKRRRRWAEEYMPRFLGMYVGVLPFLLWKKPKNNKLGDPNLVHIILRLNIWPKWCMYMYYIEYATIFHACVPCSNLLPTCGVCRNLLVHPELSVRRRPRRSSLWGADHTG